MAARYLFAGVFVPLYLFLGGCVSTGSGDSGDFNPLGGGVSIKEVSATEYHIVAKTNFSASENYYGARKIWAKAATRACGGDTYGEAGVEEKHYRHTASFLGVIPYVITEKSGTAMCSTADTDDERDEVPATPGDLL